MQRLGLIGGTGLDHWGEAIQSHQLKGKYDQASAGFDEYHVGDLKLFFLPRHGSRHTIPPHAVNYQANMDGFAQLEVDAVIAVNAVGGISSDNSPGSLTVPDQLIDYTWGREHSYSLTSEDDLQHIEFAHPFAGQIRSQLITAASHANINVTDGGCLGVSQGPRLETAAEIRRFKNDGCDMIGMTSMPEAALARELKLDYASLCVNANWAAGLETTPVSMDAIDATLKNAMGNVRKLLMMLFREFTNG